MWDTKVGLATVSIEFRSKIIGVKMNSHILYAATKEKIFLHSLVGL